jgi:hypothetical protein
MSQASCDPRSAKQRSASVSSVPSGDWRRLPGTTLADDFLAGFAGRDTYRVVLIGLDVERQIAGRDPVSESLYI